MVVKWLFNFVLITFANVIFYYLFWVMQRWAKNGLKIVIDLGFYQIDWQFSSFFLFIVVSALVTIPINLIGQWLLNLGYLKEALANDSLMLAQFMLWLSAPVAYTIFVVWKLDEQVNWRGFIVAMILLALAQLSVRFIK